MKKDKFGNVHTPGLPYARGELITSTQDDLVKLRHRLDLSFLKSTTAEHFLGNQDAA